jgi:predicted DNA-binding protein (MmcQ/YjbR family)
MASRRSTSAASTAIAHLRELGLRRYPGAHVKSPWPGHLDLAVNDKTFVYLSAPGDPPGVSLKLPFSRSLALQLPGAEPTAYGLGKSGWVSLSFDGHPVPPLPQLEEWLDESYRSQAPKRPLAQFEAGAAPIPAPRRAAAKVRPARVTKKKQKEKKT